MNIIFAVALGVFGVTLCIGYLLNLFFARKNPAVQRLHKFVTEDHEKRQKQGNPIPGGRIRPTLVKVLQSMSELMPVREQYASGLRLSLLQAGILRNDAAKTFASTQVVLAGILSVLGLFMAFSMNRGLFASLMFICGFALFGYYLPMIWLRGRIGSRKKQIICGLPDALDLMVVCVEAGLGLNATLLRVGQELSRHCPAVSEELLLVNREMRTGISRHDALRHLSQRNPVDDVQSFVAVLIQTDKLGSSMSRTLRTQSDSLRTKRRQRAEESAAKTSIKLLFPLVFFILPSLFVVLLGSGIIQAIKAFSGAGTSLP